MQFRGMIGRTRGAGRAILGISLLLGASAVSAQSAGAPENILPTPAPAPSRPAPPTQPAVPATQAPVALPGDPAATVMPPAPVIDPVMNWSLANAQALVGVIEQLAAAYVSPKAADILIFAPLLLILMVRPWGLFGQRELGRV